jgi:lipid-binding SYLF domain-containing protein
MTTRATLIAAMLAAGAIVGQASADVVGVSRCDEAVNGVYRPGLLTVESDGTRTFHPVGENGLTETITFNRTRRLRMGRGARVLPGRHDVRGL